MGVLIQWRKKETEHTGSAELNGVTDKPAIYVHPRDNHTPNVQPRRSPSVRWEYNHDDAGETPVEGNAFEVTVEGQVSYETYLQMRNRWRALPNPPSTFEDQEAANEVFSSPAPATNVQPSGQATYEAWMRMNPHEAQDKRVSLTAVVALFARANGSPPSQYGGGKAVVSNASLWKGAGPQDSFRNIRVNAATKVGQDEKTDTHTETYTVTVPAGEFVKIGEVRVGPGFMIMSGSNTFVCKSKITYTPHRNLQPDSVHQGCNHIDTSVGGPGSGGASGSGN